MPKQNRPGYHLVFCRYIRRNGKLIFPKNGRLFCFWAKNK